MRAGFCLSLLAAWLWSAAVAAQCPPTAPAEEATPRLLDCDRLSGGWNAACKSLDDRGITLSAVSTNEVLGNPSGGTRQGVAFEGNLQVNLTINLEKAVGWCGATFHASAYEIYGRGLSAGNIGNLLTVSGFEATASTRLYDLYLEQSLLDGKLSVRVGQFAADEEFIASEYAGLFVNSTFGWPGLAAIDLPSGGPSYPLATPGVRIKAQIGDQLTLLGAVFDGNPAGPGSGDPQVRDASGTLFRVNDGVLVIAEAQYAINQGDDAEGLPGTYRFGGWYNSESFDDQHLDNLGLSLADPASTGEPRQHRGDYSLYVVADQMVWRKPGSKDAGVGVFARVMGAPGDRNLVNFYADAGVNWKGPFDVRSDDTIGVAVGYARISDAARALDADTAFYTGTAFPIRSNETVLELTYQCQIAEWWNVQPDLQFVFNPGGGVLNPDKPGQRIGNAVVLALRSVINF